MRRRFFLAAALAVAGVLILSLVVARWAGEGPMPAPRGSVGEPARQDTTQVNGATLSTVSGGVVPVKRTAPPHPPAPGDIPGRRVTLSGRVLRAETRGPVAGAVVRVALDFPGVPLRWLHEVSAGADGSFEVAEAGEGPYRVHASAPGHIDNEVLGALPGEGVLLLLEIGAGVPCRVVLEGEDGIEPVPDREVRLAVYSLGWSLEARTDWQGAFVLSGITSEDFEAARQVADIDTVVAGYSEPSIARAPDEEGFLVTVEPGMTVHGVVLDGETHAPIDGAILHADSGHEAVSGPRGAFSMTGVSLNVTAFAKGYAPVTLEAEEEEGEGAQLEFLLRRGVILHGRVRDGAGKPVPGVQVGIAPGALDLDSTSPFLEEEVLNLLASTSDAQGLYRIEGLPAEALDLPGDVELELQFAGGASRWREEVAIDQVEGRVEKDLVLDIVSDLEGTVAWKDGGPIARATVFFERPDNEHVEAAVTGLNGAFRLRHIIAGLYELRVDAGGRTVHLDRFSVPGASTDIRVERPVKVEGSVVADDDGQPLEGLRVRLFPGSNRTAPALESATIAGGRFFIEGVPRGSHMLLVEAGADAGPASHLAPMMRVPIVVDERGWNGQVRHTILPSGEVLVRFVIGQGEGPTAEPVRVRVIPARSPRLHPRGKVTGEISVPPGAELAARWREGSYKLECVLGLENDGPSETVSIVVPAGGRVERTVTFSR
ncbi:MAG TPA: carboxypeptidase-like regulatory domain-containing protein [Planctomycetota bacterium]|nr:carboxypeptidase-like regulatory domain-containing protein [Planctomycetota bacterium]